jgi:hypothetical protein
LGRRVKSNVHAVLAAQKKGRPKATLLPCEGRLISAVALSSWQPLHVPWQLVLQEFPLQQPAVAARGLQAPAGEPHGPLAPDVVLVPDVLQVPDAALPPDAVLHELRVRQVPDVAQDALLRVPPVPDVQPRALQEPQALADAQLRPVLVRVGPLPVRAALLQALAVLRSVVLALGVPALLQASPVLDAPRLPGGRRLAVLAAGP